jgi:hypothetical protein
LSDKEKEDALWEFVNLFKVAVGDTPLDIPEKKKTKTIRFNPKKQKQVIQDMIEKYEDILIVKEIFLNYANNPPQKTWLNKDSFLRSFYRYLIAMSDKIDDPTSMFKSNLLCREDLLDLMVKQCSLIDDLKNQCDNLQMQQSEYQEKMDIILKDQLLNQVFESVLILKRRFGEKWDKSFLHNWTLFNFKNAAADSKQALRYLKDQKFAQSIRFIKTLKFLGGHRVMTLLTGDGELRMQDGKKRGSTRYDGELNNFAIPSERTLDSFIEMGAYTDYIAPTLDNMENNMTQLIKDIKKRKVNIKWDAIYLSKTIQYCPKTNRIRGIQGKEYTLDQFIKAYEENGISMFKEEKYTSQAYVFMISTTDGKLSRPFYFYGLGSDKTDDILKVVCKALEILDKNHCPVVGVCADGGSCCRAVLRKFESKRKINGKWCRILPWSDYDHLLKTIRNSLKEKKIFMNSRLLLWSILDTEWNATNSPLLSWIHADAISVKDKMSSAHLRQVFCIQTATYLFSKGQTMSGESKTDYVQLASFIHTCTQHLEAWESIDISLLHAERYKIISETTQILSGKDEIRKICGMTVESLQSLSMNEASWKDLIEMLSIDAELSREIVFRSFSTLIVENFFSILRGKISSPTWMDFQSLFGAVTSELMKQHQGNKIGFNSGRRPKGKGSKGNSYAKETISDIGGEPTISPLVKKTSPRLQVSRITGIEKQNHTKELAQAKVLIRRINNETKVKRANLRAMVGIEPFKKDTPIERISTNK